MGNLFSNKSFFLFFIYFFANHTLSIWLVSFSFSQTNNLKINNPVDSLLLAFKTTNQDSIKLRLLIELSEECEPGDILKYAQPAVKLADKLLRDKSVKNSEKIKNLKAAAINNIGYIFMNQGDIPKALDYYQKGLKIREGTGDKKGIAESLNNIGYIYMNQGDIPRALDYYQQGLKMREETGDKKGTAHSLNNIGYIYMNQGDFLKALDYYQQSMKIKEETSDKKDIAISFNNIGYIYNNLGNIPKALDYYKQGLKMREETGDKHGIANSLNNIAYIYDIQGDNSKALDYYQKSLKMREEIGDKEGIAYSLCNIGGIYLKQKNYTLALFYSDSSLTIAKELDFPVNIRNAAIQLSKIYFAKNDYKTGHFYYKLYIQMRDSIYNEENTKQITRLETRYEIEKQLEKQKRMEDEKNRRAGERVSRRNNIQLLGSFIVVMVLLTGLILLGRFHVPVRVIEGFMFVSFILFYELIGVFADTYIDVLTGGAPAFKLIINAVIAIVLYGLNSLLERMIRRRLSEKL